MKDFFSKEIIVRAEAMLFGKTQDVLKYGLKLEVPAPRIEGVDQPAEGETSGQQTTIKNLPEVAEIFSKFEKTILKNFSNANLFLTSRQKIEIMKTSAKEILLEGGVPTFKILIAEENSNLKILDQSESGINFILAEKFSNIEYFERPENTSHPQNKLFLVYLKDGAKINFVFQNKSQTHHKKHLKIILAGDSSEAKTKTRIELAGEEIYDEAIEIEHLGKSSRSEIDFRAIVSDLSWIIERPEITLKEIATNSFGKEEIRIIKSHETAKIDAIPSLHVEGKGSFGEHSFSVEEIGKEALNFLKIRGESEAVAKKLLADAFLEKQL